MAAPVAGQLISLDVVRGQQVKQNQTLFTLIMEPEISELAQAKAQVQQAEFNVKNLKLGKRPSEIESLQQQLNQALANEKLAKITYTRDRILANKNAIPQQTADESLARLQADSAHVAQLQADLVTAKLGSRDNEIKAAEANYVAARANLKRLQWLLDQKVVKAPVAGQIVETYFEKGEQVAANQSVVSLLAPPDKRVIFFIPEAALSTIKIGQKIQVNCDSCKNSQTAVISYIAPNAEYTPPVIYSNESRYKLVYRIKAKFSDQVAAQFHPGQPVQVIVYHQ